MRNMSFSMTTEQIRNRTKTVTRRKGWRFLKPGALVQPVLKVQGLRVGEKVQRIGKPIRVVSARRERLDRMLLEPDYGIQEVRLEGFAGDPVKGWPDSFVHWFAINHQCLPSDEITRIEFEYV